MQIPEVRIDAGPAATLAEAGVDALAVGLFADEEHVRLGSGAAAIGKTMGVDLTAHVLNERANGRAQGKAGQISVIPVLSGVIRAIVLVGLGDAAEAAAPPFLRCRAAIKSGAALGRLGAAHPRIASTIAADLSAEGLRAFVEGLVLATYSPGFDGKSEPTKRLSSAQLRVPRLTESKSSAVSKAVITAGAVWKARELINQPSLIKTPAWLAGKAKKLEKHPQISVTVVEEKELEKRGFGGIVGVGKGSTRPPRLAQINYAPVGKAIGHVVLVGKGITFDTGGLSLKPNDGMVAMKTDMAGAAAVIATLKAVALLELKVRVTGLVAMAENMPSGTAMRPGDVLRHYGGSTVEVLNTDAEGRLVLADALVLASEFKPDAIIDIATLTGAMPMALGRKIAGLFCSDDDLCAKITAAGEAAGERSWRLPLTDDYRDSLESPVADMTNISRAVSYQGGSIVAALFLREFTAGQPWAHLDIAGVGRSDGDDEEITKGGTGFGVRTFLRLLESW